MSRSALKVLNFIALAALTAATASAVPVLTITNGASVAIITDGGAGDNDGLVNGLISVSNLTVGNYNVSGSGSTDPFLPASTQQTNSITVTQIASGPSNSITFDFFETDYTLAVTGFNQDLTLNPNVPTGTASASYDQFVNGVLANNVSAGPSSVSVVSSPTETFAAVVGPAMYSLRQVTTLTFANAGVGSFAGFTSQLTPIVVPEPQSVALFGTLLLGCASLLRKKFAR